MKLLITKALLLLFLASSGQWRKVEQLPSSDIFSIYHKDNTLYAGGKNKIYFSRDNGQSWDSTAIIPQISMVNNIIVYNSELYAAAPKSGVFKSTDGGKNWSNNSAGIYPEVADFCEYKGVLYAATLGNSIYRLDSVTRNHWYTFHNGLSNLSANINSIGGNGKVLIAGTNNNGLYDYLSENSSTWAERFLMDRIRPNEGAYDIITAHDTLLYAGHTGRFYISTDDGVTWKFFSKRLISANTSLVNTKQALILSRYIFDGAHSTTGFFYLRKDSIQNGFTEFSEVISHFSYKIDISGDKIWDASTQGLFYMPLSVLPGITAANDTALRVVSPFQSFEINCQPNNVVLAWTTAPAQNGSYFNIERSLDGRLWTVIGSQPASAKGATNKTYSYADALHQENLFYRIAAHDGDDILNYSRIQRSTCTTAGNISVWPNPAHDRIFMIINVEEAGKAVLTIYNNWGELVKTENKLLFQGSNQVATDIYTMPNGIYYLSIQSDKDKLIRNKVFIKQ